VTDIDPTKYYIESSSQRDGGPDCTVDSAAHVKHASENNSASFSAYNSSPSDKQASVRLRCIADSAPNIAAAYNSQAANSSSTDACCRSSSHLPVWQSGRRGRTVEGPPTSQRPTQLAKTNRPSAVGDLNLTNSMTSLIQSGSTSSHVWPSMSTSATSLTQAGVSKPPSANRRGRPVKRVTQRLQSDDREIPATSNNRLIRPTSVDVVSRPDMTPLMMCPESSVHMNGKRLRSTSSSVFSLPDGATKHLSTTPIKLTPATNALLRRRVSVDGLPLPRPLHDASKTSIHGNWNQLRPVPICLSEETEMPVTGELSTTSNTTSAQTRQTQQQSTDSRCRRSTSLATNGCQGRPQHMTIEPGLCPKPRPGLNPISDKPKRIQRKKTLSLAEITSGQEMLSSGATKSGFPVGAVASFWCPRDVTNMADTSVGGAGSHESLSDEGYQTKDSGSSLSLNQVQFHVQRRGPWLSAYL